MREQAIRGIAIGAVARQTGIPVTTLRFYERELPGLFPIRKTAGGHRRYGARDVARFATVRSLTERGLALAELRRVLADRGEPQPLLEAVERLTDIQETQARTLELLARRLEELGKRLDGLETRPGLRGWFKKG